MIYHSRAAGCIFAFFLHILIIFSVDDFAAIGKVKKNPIKRMKWQKQTNKRRKKARNEYTNKSPELHDLFIFFSIFLFFLNIVSGLILMNLILLQYFEKKSTFSSLCFIV